MPYCQCGNEFSEARARLGFDCCLECGKKEAAAEITRRAHMIPDKPQIRLHLSGLGRGDAASALARGLGQDTPDGNWCPGDRPCRPPQAGKAQAL
jgi:hypothetical protein